MSVTSRSIVVASDSRLVDNVLERAATVANRSPRSANGRLPSTDTPLAAASPSIVAARSVVSWAASLAAPPPDTTFAPTSPVARSISRKAVSAASNERTRASRCLWMVVPTSMTAPSEPATTINVRRITASPTRP